MKICVSYSPRLLWIRGSIDPLSVLEDLGTFFSQLCLSLGRQYLPAIPCDAPAAIYSDTLEDMIRCWVMSAYPKRERAFWAQAGYRENQLAWLRCAEVHGQGETRKYTWLLTEEIWKKWMKPGRWNSTVVMQTHNGKAATKQSGIQVPAAAALCCACGMAFPDTVLDTWLWGHFIQMGKSAKETAQRAWAEMH